jgi:hypothetical protein
MQFTGGEFDSPYQPGSPEEAEYQKGKMRGFGLSLSQILPAWATMVVPRGEDAEGQSHWNIPGAITGAYSSAGEYGPMAANWVGRKLGFQTNLPSLPGADAAGQAFAESAKWAKDTIPQPMTPENESEQRVADIAFGGASTALPVGGALTSLPRIARMVGSAVLPHGVGGAALGAGVTGAVGAHEDAARDKILTDAGLDPAEIRKIREGGQPDLTQPDTTQEVAHPQTGAAATIPFPTGSDTIPDQLVGQSDGKYDTLAAFGRPDIKIMTPDFDTTGRSGTSFGEAIGLGTLGLIAAPLLMRYGGRLLDPAIKLIAGQGDRLNTATNVKNFNANLDAIDAGKVMGPATVAQAGAVRGEAPLPGKAGTVGTNLAQAAWDKNRVLTEMSNATAPDTGVAKQMEAEIGTINHSTPLMNSIAEQMGTGVVKANGGKLMPSWKDTLQNVDNLTPEQTTKLENGLYAGDELDTRKMKFDAASNAGQPINDDTAFRHNYRNVHSDVLRSAHSDMMSDPATASIANDIYTMQTAHIQNAFDMGRLTQADMARILKQRPRQIPSTNLEGVIEHALGERDTTTPGWETPPTRAVDALTQHYGKLYEELSKNRLDDQLIKQIKTWQDADPSRQRIVNEVLDGKGNPVPTAEGRVHTVYRDGVPHTYNIDNTNLYRAFKGNVAQTRMLLNTADSLRRSYQSGTTGLGATFISQRPFSFISLNRNIPQIATDRAPGTHFGVVDRLMQQATGGRVGYRGPDPTHWVGSYNEAIRGSGAVTAKAMSEALRNPSNPVTMALKQWKGDLWTKAWAAKLEQRYQGSTAAAKRAAGAGGVGSAGVYERPTFNIQRGNRVGYSPMADVVPGVFHPDGIAIPYTKVRIPYTKGITSNYINMRSWLREVHSEISEGANTYYWKSNPQLSDAQRTFQTRQVIGDPSMHGASVAAQRATHLIPWINPSVQDAVRMMRNLRDNPVAFTLGTVHSLGMAAAASLLSAMLGGSKHLNMLGRLMSTHDRASNVTFFHNPDDEHDYTQISLPQRWRMLYPIILEGLSEGIGSFNARQGEDAYNRIVHSLSDLFSQHISSSTMVGAREGAQDFAGVFQPPPALQAVAAVAGKQINEPIAQVIKNVGEGQKPFSNMVQDTDKAGRLPGQAAPNSYVANDDANWIHQVMRAVLGIAGDGYTKATNFTSRLNLEHGLAEAMSGLVTDAGQSWRDNAPFGNMIWGNNVKLSPSSPIEEANRVAWDAMQKMPKQTDIDLAGLSRRGGVPVTVPGVPKINEDPGITRMVSTINNYHSLIGKTVEPQLTDIRAQIKDLNDSPYFSAQDKRSLGNDLIAKKNELESQKNLMIEKMNGEMSEIAGGKHVDVRRFNPQRGMDQFHD